MKKFIKNIFLSIIIAFFICVIFDYAISKYLQGTHWRKYDTWTKIVNSEFQDNDMLIFGSSRAWRHFSPIILDSILNTNSYNMGIDGSSFDRQYLRWEMFKTFGNHKPNFIIQNIDYLTTLDYTNRYEIDQLFPYIWNNKFRDLKQLKEELSIYERIIPMYRYFMYGLRLSFIKEKAPSKKGYECSNNKWNSSSFKKIGSLIFAYNDVLRMQFEEFISEALSDSINVILVMAPMYEGVKDKATQLNLMYSVYHEISDKYNIPILDYTFCDISKDTTNFYNATHLNKKGSEFFSIKLANDLKKTGIIDKSSGRIDVNIQP